MSAPERVVVVPDKHHARLTRSKWVFRAYLDARALGEDDEAAELFALWLRLLERERAP